MNKNLTETKDIFVDTVLINDEIIVQKLKNINHNFKISVILSSYRKENNLVNILDKLLSQTYKNFEIIVVDDTTNNNIENIFEKYSIYENINYIKKQLGSKSSAKNIAIENSKSDYILFIEEDIIDIENNYLEIMYNAISKNNNDLLILANSSNLDFINKYFSNLDDFKGAYYLKKELEFFNSNIDVSLASFMFKKQFLLDNNLKFRVDILEGENIYFKFNLFDKVEKISIATDSSYIKKYSRKSRKNKILESINVRRLLHTLDCILEFSKNKIYKNEVYNYYLFSNLEFLKYSSNKEIEAIILKNIKDNIDNVSNINFFERILLRKSPKLFIKIFLNKEEF